MSSYPYEEPYLPLQELYDREQLTGTDEKIFYLKSVTLSLVLTPGDHTILSLLDQDLVQGKSKILLTLEERVRQKHLEVVNIYQYDPSMIDGPLPP